MADACPSKIEVIYGTGALLTAKRIDNYLSGSCLLLDHTHAMWKKVPTKDRIFCGGPDQRLNPLWGPRSKIEFTAEVPSKTSQRHVLLVIQAADIIALWDVCRAASSSLHVLCITHAADCFVRWDGYRAASSLRTSTRPSTCQTPWRLELCKSTQPLLAALTTSSVSLSPCILQTERTVRSVTMCPC